MAEEQVDMSKMSASVKRKYIYRKRLVEYLDTYKSILMISVDFVGSNQMQQVRQALRGKAVILMGKNTVIRRVFAEQMEARPFLNDLLPHVKGNVGFVFTNGDLNAVRKVVIGNKVPAAAKAGIISPINVIIPKGPTTQDPGQTSFFQALNIATKITRGAIEIINDVDLCQAGVPVSAGAAALLSKLGLKPFFFGIEVTTVCDDGSVYAAAVLDMTEDDLINRFCSAANVLAAISLELGTPNLVSIPHSIKYTFKKLVAIALETGVMFKEAEDIKNNAGSGGSASAGDAPAAAAAAPEPEEEEEEAAPANLFGDGDAAAADY